MSRLPQHVIQGREQFVSPFQALPPVSSVDEFATEETVDLWTVNYVEGSIRLGDGKPLDLDDFLRMAGIIAGHRKEFHYHRHRR
jgi:hypothetical protein